MARRRKRMSRRSARSNPYKSHQLNRAKATFIGRRM